MISNSALYIIFAGIYILFVVYLLQQMSRHKMRFTLIAILILVGLIYDNLVIGLGNSIGEGGLLKNLNVGRYLYHVVFTPILTMFAYDVLKKAGISWLQNKKVFWFFILITLALMVIGVFIDLLGMEMVLVIENNVTRYVNASAAGKIPIPAVVVNLILIFSGLLIWREKKVPWLALGSILMFIMYGISPGNLLISNIGEIAFCGGIVGINYELLKIIPNS